MERGGIVRRKYGQCEKPCCQGVTIAALPPRLVPQSKLGLGLAVYLLLSRFDDHVAYYTLERNFRERFGVVISRQQMVQWVEKVAHLLLAIYWLIWEELKAGDYLQSWNWGDYGWSGPGSTSYSKTATPNAWSMRDPYHLAMASFYVWDACENGKRVTKWKAAGGIQWTWDKKTKQWTGPDPVKQ